MPVRVLITEGSAADCSHASELIKDITAEHLLADKGYDTDAIVAQAQEKGMQVVLFPPKKNRKIQRPYDKDLYRLRHLVENAFLHLKCWRGVATRYAINASSFLAPIQIRCIALWASIS